MKLRPRSCVLAPMKTSKCSSTKNLWNNLGVIVRSINKTNQDLFSSNYRFISDKSQKAIFNMKKKLKFVQNVSPSIMFDMFDTLIRPILNYGSDVWGLSRSGLESLDKVFLHYVRCILCIKATTCNAIVYGECGRYPPSITCHVNVLCYLHWLLTMESEKMVKSIFCALNALHDQGFPPWVTKAYELAKDYDIDMDGSVMLTTKQFKSLCFERTKSSFVTNWNADLREKPLLRSYRLYKTEFNTECYLDCINLPKYRIPVSKMRASSHDLEIERGRYTRPRLDPNQRLCSTCLEVEDEEHFVTSCRVNINERQTLFTKISSKDPTFMHLDDREKIHICYVLQRQTNTNVVWKIFAQVIYYSKTDRSCIPPQHAGTSWWSTENFCVHWLTMLIFCFTVSMIWYRHIQRHIACALVLYIPAYIRSVA